MYHKQVNFKTAFSDISIRTSLNYGAAAAASESPATHTHAFYELLAAVHGTLRIERLGGNEILLQKGDLCLVPPHHYHYTKGTDETAVSFASLCFTCESNGVPQKDGAFVVCRAALETLKEPLHLAHCERECALLESINTELTGSAPAAEDMAEALLKQFYVAFFRRLWQWQQTPLSPVTERANDCAAERYNEIESFVYAHYQEPLTAERLARHLGLSKRQLSRVLKEFYGQTFRELLVQTRLHRAVQLLSETGDSVESIAYAVGYTSLSGFYAAFQKQFHLPAHQYRKNLGKKD